MLPFVPTRLVVAGWTGRDAAAIQHHIDELARLGVARPSAVPLYYRVASQMLTQQAAIEVVGSTSSGEAEPVLLRADGQWWLTVGSDHTDRSVEAYSVAVSKQMCAKPIAAQVWRWDDVAAHADELALRSEVFEDGRWVTYQQGRLAAIRPLMDLVDRLRAALPIDDGLVMFCGTLVVKPDASGRAIRPTPQFRIELADERRQSKIVHEYVVNELPLVA
jgi:hypothetical protein